MLLKNPLQVITKKALFSKVLLLLWPLYQLSQVPNARIYLLDLIVLLSVIFQAKKLRLNQPLTKPLIFFLSTATISLVLAFIRGFGSNTAVLYLARMFLYSSLLFVALPKKTPQVLYLSFLLVPVLGLTQYLLLPDLRFLKTIGYDDHYFRLTFPFLDPNYTGAVLSFVSLYAISIIKEKKGKFLLALSIPSLALTFSRISYLSFVVGLIYLFVKKKKRQLPILLALIGLVALVAMAPKPFGEGVNLKRTYSITSRLTNLANGLNIFSNNPIVGIGYNTLSFSYSDRSGSGVDNSYIFILVTTGMVGMVSFFNLVWKAGRLVKNTYLKAALLSLFTHALSNNTLFYAPITILVFLVLNLSGRSSRK